MVKDDFIEFIDRYNESDNALTAFRLLLKDVKYITPLNKEDCMKLGIERGGSLSYILSYYKEYLEENK